METFTPTTLHRASMAGVSEAATSEPTEVLQCDRPSVRGQQQAVGNDLAVVVDGGGVLDLGAGPGRDQGVEVLHRAAAVDRGAADHHTVVVDRRREEAAQV